MCLPLSVLATGEGTTIIVKNTSDTPMVATLWMYSEDSSRWYNFYGGELDPGAEQLLLDRYPSGLYGVKWYRLNCETDCTYGMYTFLIEAGTEIIIIDTNGP